MTIQQHASFGAGTAELNATSKLMKAWEAKNAKHAARAGGLTLMAVSLAACGGSDDVVVDLSPFTQAELDAAVDAAVAAVDITADNQALIDAAVAAVDITTVNQALIDAAVAAVDTTTDNQAVIDAAVPMSGE